MIGGVWNMRVVLASLVFVAACGDSDPGPQLPLLVEVGGPKLAHPALVPIFYADDSDATVLTQYSQWIVTSRWLDAVGGEYGVGAGSVPAVIRRTDNAPFTIDDTEIVDLLFAGLADKTLPPPTPDTLYLLNTPERTVVTAGTALSCREFGGYHASARRDGIELAYAVVATCGDVVGREIVVSHELIEAATDPFPASNPGVQLRDPSSPWLALGEEVADLCQRGGDVSEYIMEAGFTAQRSYSNVAAAADQNPCVPQKFGTSYFNVVPHLEALPRIPPGSHKTIELTGWASDGRGDWKIRAAPAEIGAATLTLGAPTLGNQGSTTLDIAIPSVTRVGSTILMFVASNFGGEFQLMPLVAIAGQPCASFTDCASCTGHGGCGFCSTSGRCESAGADGSADSSCAAGAFATWEGSCPGLCSSHSASCTDCASQVGCGWCAAGDGPACVEASHEYSHPQTGSCAYADWSFTPGYCPLGPTPAR
jgi:hypothetical protein